MLRFRYFAIKPRAAVEYRFKQATENRKTTLPPRNLVADVKGAPAQKRTGSTKDDSVGSGNNWKVNIPWFHTLFFKDEALTRA